MDLCADPAGVTALLAGWTGRLACGPRAGTSDSPTGEGHYQLLKHLPDDSLLLLLYILITHDFPTSWKTAIITPVLKMGKVLSDPGSYRSISLTSCLCKTMEQMVNSRLTWYLERDMVITEYQSRFRRRRSSVDNIVTLETSIRHTFVGRQHLVSIFIDSEKAYDNTWKHGILLDFYKTDLRGCLPMFVYL